MESADGTCVTVKEKVSFEAPSTEAGILTPPLAPGSDSRGITQLTAHATGRVPVAVPGEHRDSRGVESFVG